MNATKRKHLRLMLPELEQLTHVTCQVAGEYDVGIRRALRRLLGRPYERVLTFDAQQFSFLMRHVLEVLKYLVLRYNAGDEDVVTGQFISRKDREGRMRELTWIPPGDPKGHVYTLHFDPSISRRENEAGDGGRV